MPTCAMMELTSGVCAARNPAAAPARIRSFTATSIPVYASEAGANAGLCGEPGDGLVLRLRLRLRSGCFLRLAAGERGGHAFQHVFHGSFFVAGGDGENLVRHVAGGEFLQIEVHI